MRRPFWDDDNDDDDINDINEINVVKHGATFLGHKQLEAVHPQLLAQLLHVAPCWWQLAWWWWWWGCWWGWWWCWLRWWWWWWWNHTSSDRQSVWQQQQGQSHSKQRPLQTLSTHWMPPPSCPPSRASPGPPGWSSRLTRWNAKLLKVKSHKNLLSAGYSKRAISQAHVLEPMYIISWIEAKYQPSTHQELCSL